MPSLPEGYAERLERAFPGTLLEFEPGKERWQFVRKLYVEMLRPRKTLIVLPGESGEARELVANFWVVHVCETPKGGYRLPNEADLDYLASVDMERRRRADIEQDIRQAQERYQRTEQQANEDLLEDAEQETVHRLKIAHNVPNVQAGVEFQKNGKVKADAAQPERDN